MFPNKSMHQRSPRIQPVPNHTPPFCLPAPAPPSLESGTIKAETSASPQFLLASPMPPVRPAPTWAASLSRPPSHCLDSASLLTNCHSLPLPTEPPHCHPLFLFYFRGAGGSSAKWHSMASLLEGKPNTVWPESAFPAGQGLLYLTSHNTLPPRPSPSGGDPTPTWGDAGSPAFRSQKPFPESFTTVGQDTALPHRLRSPRGQDWAWFILLSPWASPRAKLITKAR